MWMEVQTIERFPQLEMKEVHVVMTAYVPRWIATWAVLRFGRLRVDVVLEFVVAREPQ